MLKPKYSRQKSKANTRVQTDSNVVARYQHHHSRLFTETPIPAGAHPCLMRPDNTYLLKWEMPKEAGGLMCTDITVIRTVRRCYYGLHSQCAEWWSLSLSLLSNTSLGFPFNRFSPWYANRREAGCLMLGQCQTGLK